MLSDEHENQADGKDEDISLAECFQNNILDLVKFYKSLTLKITAAGATTPCSSTILDVAHIYIKSRNGTELIVNFIDKSWRDWDLFPSKNEDCLYKNIKALFPAIPDDHLLNIRQIFDVSDSKGKKIVSENDKKVIWDFVLELIRMSVLYVHSERCWGRKAEGKMGYTKVFFKEISISKYGELFDVELNKPSS